MRSAIAGSASPACRRVIRVPAGTALSSKVSVVGAPVSVLRHDQAIRRGGSISSTSHSALPGQPGSAGLRSENRWPIRGTKSFGISQAASASLSVSARQTVSRG